jgi:hypothetical protein
MYLGMQAVGFKTKSISEYSEWMQYTKRLLFWPQYAVDELVLTINALMTATKQRNITLMNPVKKISKHFT